LPKNYAFIVAIIDGIAETRNALDIAFNFDPIPMHFLDIIDPKARLARHFIIVVVVSTPQHEILIIQVQEGADLLCWLCICDDFLYPNVRLCAHRSIQEPQLIEIVEEVVDDLIFVSYHPFTSE
jgi:hypothetical protein